VRVVVVLQGLDPSMRMAHAPVADKEHGPAHLLVRPPPPLQCIVQQQHLPVLLCWRTPECPHKPLSSHDIVPTCHPPTLAFAVARFGDPEHAERTVFATLHDLEAIFKTHEALEQQKTPKKHRGPPFVVSPVTCSGWGGGRALV
jgi:hypothetical protein